ncbi:shikimate dehydrogenase [Paraglaciecola chathamensis]|uniref:Shikimate dehydrogenase (NADP(+)) n=1 Tax=Paraglaciecola chathamensis TaxID=368405 RepID=A0ABS0WH42_9ALTE|nr:shikimate dehydrogenase [Paraglaciecola chathamensis]MBJ2137800.1 shikimate dehydrogenase [Paraglaciecola chathamensis]
MSLEFLKPITGSFAKPAAENPTVVMVNAAYQELGLDWTYINCEVDADNLKMAVLGAKAMGWAGFNCSIPHKVSVIQHLDRLGESAKLIGAVNTVVIKDGLLIGENTDGKGFVEGVKQVVSPKDKRVLIFGAGGAARAVSVELALAGVRSIRVVNRNVERGQVLVNLLNSGTDCSADLVTWDQTIDIPADIDIVINATSIGLYPNINDRLNMNPDTLLPNMVVADGIHNPAKTHLIEEAIARNCSVVDGLTMLVNQGVLGIKYWTGLDSNASLMRQSLNDVLGHIK